jgi:hypothetical protein
MSPRPSKTGIGAADLTALTFCAASLALLTWYYLSLRSAFFDDVFISLHIARNGADHWTWQYFVLMNRPALLGSSPLKIFLLTIAAKITTILGFTGRTFFNAKLVLIVYAPLSWAIWYPFWKKRIAAFACIGAIYFTCALCLDAAVDFEGGLLFCWVATVALLVGEPENHVHKLGWAIPLGFLIRPDAAIPVVAATAVILGGRVLWRIFLAALARGAALGIIWSVLCWLMHVWPIPVTYWVKAALPTLTEEKLMIEVFFERLGLVAASRLLNSSAAATLLGVVFVLSFVLVTVRDGRARLAGFAAVVTSGLLLLHVPSGFWWYYQNDIMVLIGVAMGLLARHRLSEVILTSGIRPVGAFVLAAMLTLLAGKAFVDGPTGWRMDAPSRGQAYAYIGSKAMGDGSYELAGIGNVFIKNPEIGMTSYFSGDKAWLWDSGGLAQPLPDPLVQNSTLRHFFPERLRETALTDVKILASRAHKPLRVVDVWAMDDRDFAKARKKCRYVIEEGAVCSNDFLGQGKPQ